MPIKRKKTVVDNNNAGKFIIINIMNVRWYFAITPTTCKTLARTETRQLKTSPCTLMRAATIQIRSIRLWLRQNPETDLTYTGNSGVRCMHATRCSCNTWTSSQYDGKKKKRTIFGHGHKIKIIAPIYMTAWNWNCKWLITFYKYHQNRDINCWMWNLIISKSLWNHRF